MLKGLNDIIPDHLLSIFDENELEVTGYYHYLIIIGITVMYS